MSREYDEADEQLWGEAPPRDPLDAAIRAEDPFFNRDQPERQEPEPVEHYAERLAFWWRCGSCDDVNESEFDQRREVVECPACGAKGKLMGDY